MGQLLGDTGWLEFSDEKIRVLDTKKENDLVIHVVDKLPKYIQDPTVHCHVDAEKRHFTENNHSATHLLHAALRERLGPHVRQAGSAVRPDKLRFDFTHGAALSDEEARDVENRVNGWIKQSRPVRATDAITVSVSSGFTERRSTTSIS